MTTHSPTDEIYTAILAAYHHFNTRLFDGILPACLITLQRNPKTMGYVSPQRWQSVDGDTAHELAVNPEYFLGYPVGGVFQTLVHEQCHVWQYQEGLPGRRGYHNKQWAEKMTSIGLMPSATGSPGGKTTGEHMNDYIVEGGLFYAAAVELTTSGFALPWLDRATHAVTEQPLALFDPMGNPVCPDPEDPAGQLASPLGGGVLPAHASGSTEAETGAILPLPPKPKSTRVKYRCGECGSQVWGKPGLNVMCGDCGCSFEPA